MTPSISIYGRMIGRRHARRSLHQSLSYLLLFLVLLKGTLTCFDGRCNTDHIERRPSILVEAFTSVHPSSLLSPRSPLQLLARQTKETIVDDQYAAANSTVHYSDVINLISNANYMDTETKKRFIDSLQAEFSSASRDVNKDQDGSEIEAAVTPDSSRTKVEGFRIPTVEGAWEDDGGFFHATGAWQTTPLLMKGAFLDDIGSSTHGDTYPFPSWEEIIELACDGGTELDDQDIDEFSFEPEFLQDENDESNFDEADYDDEGLQNQYETWVGDSEDDKDFEDNDDDFYLWENGDDYDDDEDINDNPPSRLIQHWWPRQDGANYYHADVNTNWLDTFEIKQFGPFNDPTSLEALLRTEDEEHTERDVARTLLVNDVDRWFPKLSDWMDRRFNNNKSKGGVLPARWRRDDAQISLSYPKGGIGPHVDDYDVFLIQLEGERTWDVLWEENLCDEEEPSYSKISVRDETDSMLPESSMNGVRILNITKLQSLQNSRHGKVGTRLTRLHLCPGDCLYLPPRVLHCGTAIEASENCMTLSVGCRAPSAMELLDGLSSLMKKSAALGTSQTMTSDASIFPSDVALQSFHQRYTNTHISHGESTSTNSTKLDNSEAKKSSTPLPSSWLSPQVKKEMKNLLLEAVESALDDDVNILDPLVGRFVTKSNRLEEEEFGFDGGDGSLVPSFSYPKPLGKITHGKQQVEEDHNCIGSWASASEVLRDIFGKVESENQTFVLRRAEGISFAWSSVDDTERRKRIFRLYAQGRPPLEVFEDFEGIEEKVHGPNGSFLSVSSSTTGRLMDRIANGAPLDRAFVVDELQIPVDFENDTNHSISRLLHNLIEDGLLYGGQARL